MKKKLIVSAFFLISATGYFMFYHNNKTLKYIPKNADILVLIDVKKCTRQYISDFLMHPSQWAKEKDKSGSTVSIRESGVNIPYFLQIFHVKNTPLNQWYSIFEIEDEQKFFSYLKQYKFISTGKNTFKKDQFFLKISGRKFIIGTSAQALESISESSVSGKSDYQADSFIDGSPGSISLISGPRTRNFAVHIHADDIEIKSDGSGENFNSAISTLQQKITFLEAESDAPELKNITSLFNIPFNDSAGIGYLQATAQLRKINDTIITYGYDENFNEIEKISVQKIVQPDYRIALQSTDPEKTMQYFQHKKWINAENQFTAIPFQPNIIVKNETGIEIKSTRNPVLLSPKLKTNYIFVRNNPLLLSSIKTLSSTEKKIVSDMEYLFFGNRNQDYYVKLQFKKGRLPLMLR